MNQVFGDPDNNTAMTFFTAANFLAYSNDLVVVRATPSTGNNATANGTGIVIDNDQDYFTGLYTTTTANNAWAARYIGALGNAIEVVVWANAAVWTANSGNTADPYYTFANYFDHAPATTPYVTQVSGGSVANDALHILVLDRTGAVTGVANTVLEKYQDVSRLKDAMNSTGSGSNYYHEVIWKKSKYVYSIGVPSANVSGWGNTILSGPVFTNDANANVASLSGGSDGTVLASNVENALVQLSNPATVDISLLMTADASNVIQSYAISSVAAVRQDCVAFCSPPLANVQATTGPAASIAAYVQSGALPYSSYAVFDSGWKYMYDKYNDLYRWVPLNGDIAGLCAYTDNVRDPWWSPAGLQRGIIKNSVKLAFNPNQTDRDTLYKAGVNPVVSFPGEGTLLFGDKTFLNYNSAFSRINVRRLFIVLEKTIALAARASLFEFNDNFTRAQFVNLVTPFLRTVQGRRGITDFKVVCDTTNNTPAVIDANQFVGDIYIKPARSINYIQLNFIAVATGVSFNEVVGQAGNS